MTESLIIKWSVPKKFLFLFILLYTFFYIFPFPFDAFPQLDFIFSWYERAVNKFIAIIWENVFGLHDAKKKAFSDSGDTTLDFAKFFVFAGISSIAAIGILIVDKKRNNYETLRTYLFVYLRYCIGFYLLVYGFDKVFKSHFPFPSLEKLQQPFGESSPQGLLWAFMGYSTTYSVYLGIIEVGSGFLLLFKRTTALGALLALAIMINVAIINFSYDVPVKLFALHMVAYSLILLSPFLKSVFDFFLLRRTTKLSEPPVLILPKFFQSYRKPIKAILILAYTALFMSFSITNMRTDGDDAPKPPLYGIYRYSGSNIPDGEKLREIIFDKKTTIIKWEDQYEYHSVKIDTIARTIHFQSNKDQRNHRFVRYEIAENILTLYQNDTSSIQFRKLDIGELPLLNRKFRWVVEYPYNN